MLTKNGGGDHKRRLSRVHYICTMHCVQCTLEKQCTAHHVIMLNQCWPSLQRHICSIRPQPDIIFTADGPSAVKMMSGWGRKWWPGVKSHQGICSESESCCWLDMMNIFTAVVNEAYICIIQATNEKWLLFESIKHIEARTKWPHRFCRRKFQMHFDIFFFIEIDFCFYSHFTELCT